MLHPQTHVMAFSFPETMLAPPRNRSFPVSRVNKLSWISPRFLGLIMVLIIYINGCSGEDRCFLFR